MAIYHFSIKMIGRSVGKSIIAAAAYRSGTRMKDEETGLVHDFRRKRGVIHTEIILCDSAPKEYSSRKALWSAVQQIEKSKDAQLARELEIALPQELSKEQQIDLIRSYIREEFISQGMSADICIHNKETDGGKSNPHAHVLLTTRGINPDGTWQPKERKVYELDADGNRIPIIDPATGFQKIGPRNAKMWKRKSVKVNLWNSQDNAERWRAAWADAVNRKLRESGIFTTVDHRSYKRQGLDIIPTQHEGYAAREIERRGGISEICEENRQVRVLNTAIEQNVNERTSVETELQQLLERQGEINERANRIIQRGTAGRDAGRKATGNRVDETGIAGNTDTEPGTEDGNQRVKKNDAANAGQRRKHPRL